MTESKTTASSVTVWEWTTVDEMQVPHAVASFCEIYTPQCDVKAQRFAAWWEAETGRATWLVVRNAR